MSGRTKNRPVPARDLLWSTEARLVFLVAVAFVLGGGGIGSALQNLAVQLAALLVLAIDAPSVARFLRTAPKGLLALIAATLALPLLQLIPLPPSLWTALPGRSLVQDSLALVGESGRWMPISVDPARTLLSFLGLLPPLAVLVLGWTLPDEGRRRITALIVALAAFAALLGAVQLISGNTVAIIQREGAETSDLQGTFANRNSSGMFFVLALIALVGWAFAQRRTAQVRLFALCLGLLLALCVLLTRSRSSMALASLVVPVLAYGLLRMGDRARYTSGRTRGLMIALGGLSLLAIAVGGMIQFGNSRLAASLHRFDSVEDIRPLIWSDTLSATHRFGLVGSGLGTFDEVFQVDESIEYLSHARVGRAHNDWLENFLEAGVLGSALIAAWCLWTLVRAIGEVRRSGRVDALAGGMILVALAIQSGLDYPLRNAALLCIAALAFCLIAPMRAARQEAGPRRRGDGARESNNQTHFAAHSQRIAEKF